jgi:von Willebrand factor type A domain-containing protein/PKD domain-containing protein
MPGVSDSTRSVLARLELLDNAGAVVLTPPDLPVTLTPSTNTVMVDLGQLSTTTLTDGLYNLRVSLLATDHQPIPGRSAQTPLYIGSPVSAAVSADPIVVPPGTSTVTTKLEVASRLLGGGGSDQGPVTVQGNLALAIPGATARASSTFSSGFSPLRAIDGDLGTSWFTAVRDAANLGTSPYFEILLPVDATVTTLRMFGNRRFANGFDFFAGIFQLFDAGDQVLFDSGEVTLPAPNRDVELPIPNVTGVRRVRFTATADESDDPGFAELEVMGSATLPPRPRTTTKTDVVFIIDTSSSMADKIDAVREGLGKFISNVFASGIDARFAIVRFGGATSLVLDLTNDISQIQAKFNSLTDDRGGIEPGLEAIRMVLGESVEVGGGIEALHFRPDARKNLLLLTDEDSDIPILEANRLPGQVTAGPPAIIAGTDWQTEVDNTAQAIIANQAFINLLIAPDEGATKLQYGDPSSDVSDTDLLNFDPVATLTQLETHGSGNSLQAQVLQAGLVGRSFNVSCVNEPDFVNNFFAAKLEEVVVNQPTVTIEVHHHLPANGYAVDPASISPDAETVTASEILWRAQQRLGEPPLTFQLTGQVPNMIAGESRAIRQGSTILTKFINFDGAEISSTLELPPVVVVAEHLIDLDPTSRTVERGAQATYSVLLKNPLSTGQSFTLSTIGLEGLGVSLDTSVTVKVIITNVGTETDTYSLSGSFPSGFSGVLEEQTVTILPGLGNFREINLMVTPPPGTSTGNRSFTVTATSTKDSTVSDVANGVVTVAGQGVDVSMTPHTGNPASTFQMTVRNTGQNQDTFTLELGGVAALGATLGTTTVTLAPNASQVVPVTLGALTFALAGSLDLLGKATSQSNTAVHDQDTATVTSGARKGLAAAFDPTLIELSTPGSAAFLLLVDNTGTGEDAYKAEITGTTDPVTAALSGLDHQPTQTIPLFRLPGISTGGLLLNTELTAMGEGTVTVTVTSLNPSSLTAQATATVRTPGGPTNHQPVVNAGPDQGAKVGQTISLAPATFTDTDLAETHTATVDWGDGGQTGGTVNESNGNGTVTASHSYTQAGPFTVTVCVTDNHQASGCDTLTVTVTSGALINSFLCYRTRSSNGDLCTADAPVNAGGECETEEECGGTTEATSFCVPPQFPRDLEVILADQFEPQARVFAVRKPVNLCNPAEVEETSLLDPATHLRGYQVEATPGRCTAAAPQRAGAGCSSEEECGGTRKRTSFCVT